MCVCSRSLQAGVGEVGCSSVRSGSCAVAYGGLLSLPLSRARSLSYLQLRHPRSCQQLFPPRGRISYFLILVLILNSRVGSCLPSSGTMHCQVTLCLPTVSIYYLAALSRPSFYPEQLLVHSFRPLFRRDSYACNIERCTCVSGEESVNPESDAVCISSCRWRKKKKFIRYFIR